MRQSEKEINFLDRAFKVLPIIPIFGILYQIRALYGVSKMSGLVFFSWTQVINDTVGVFPFVIPLILSIGAGLRVSHWFMETWTTKKKGVYFEFFHLVFKYTIVGIFVSSVLGVLCLSVFGEWSWQGIFIFTKLYGFYYFCGSLGGFMYQKMSLNTGIFKYILPWIALGYISMIGLYYAFPAYQNSVSTDLCIWREKDILIPIKYMNDRFAFYSGSVISDSGSETMGTGIIVFSRLENDRVIHCKLKDKINK